MTSLKRLWQKIATGLKRLWQRITGRGVETTPTPTRGVPILLDRERHIRFSMGTVRKLREELGENALEEGVAVDMLPRLMWYGLKHEDPELTVEQVEELVDLENLLDVMNVISQATGQRAKIEKASDPQQPASKEESDAGDDGAA
jgi:hypothetical protein